MGVVIALARNSARMFVDLEELLDPGLDVGHFMPGRWVLHPFDEQLPILVLDCGASIVLQQQHLFTVNRHALIAVSIFAVDRYPAAQTIMMVQP